MDILMPTAIEKRLISPYGGTLIDLTIKEDAIQDFREQAQKLPSIRLSERALCDLELLATGAFSPLDRFMNSQDHQRVVAEMRLSSGNLFPIPVALSVDRESAIALDKQVALRDARNEVLAVMTIEEIYEWDQQEVAETVFGTTDSRHPLVAEMHAWGRINVSGPLQVLQLPRHYDFRELRLTPAETRRRLENCGKRNVVAFQTRNPLHRAHEEITKRACEAVDGVLLLHPVVGMTKPGDVDHYTRVRTYKALAERYYDPSRILLSLLPLAMRLAGPREALWHALIRRNFGANHMIIGRDHASPGLNSDGEPFYPAYAAQELVTQFSEEIGVNVIPFSEVVYSRDDDRYLESSRIPSGASVVSLSGSEVRENYLEDGKILPEWFTRPEVAEILAETYPPRHKRGCCIWFTGLSGAGKSTIAEILTVLLQEHGRQVTLLDGDVVRTHLSRGLGFSKEDRDLNIRRIGFVASEIVRHGGVVACAAVSPYRSTRNDVRAMVGTHFVEVFVDTPISECEKRDTKGMYAKARRGEIRNFTGVDDPYEPPGHAEIRLETIVKSADDNARLIIEYLISRGFIRNTNLPGDAPDSVGKPKK